ncbi:hypothetical protein [Hyphomonas pacifica]|uniref:Uncharacterized protein n=1 Tax=Hyphomonas pacifica TaxID=1280941 RepID=A0A062U8C7_9PROT|nr:hypothetical protein [Hyphomonas pacifica]KCZ52874.1 hypothetical protein HY2_07020 [Hyphomonas pacifica]MBR9807244.1 hypothetical protein [Alphaproteobacteria bacterium]RAN35338.1 hypothetical protein HY3_08550 [Hyphomonas pacifica]RAN38270.1 hypothetical protein HY11_00220 [Hyphomonas pacifica]|tara:strand:+ start:12212 stop:12349 length:138 start_codon:yes stop_codon:yes gene_type:complete
MFGLLFWAFLIFGVIVAALGHAGFYRAVTGRGSGSNDNEESRGMF